MSAEDDEILDENGVEIPEDEDPNFEPDEAHED